MYSKDPEHPDYAPSIFVHKPSPTAEAIAACFSRYNRAKKRAACRDEEEANQCKHPRLNEEEVADVDDHDLDESEHLKQESERLQIEGKQIEEEKERLKKEKETLQSEKV